MAAIEITELDFDTIKDSLKTFLKSQETFSDYDFEGSNINILLDVLAYNTFVQSYYTNMIGNEMFLDSAQLRDSVVSHAKELAYVPTSRTGSEATVQVAVVPVGSPATITIPRFTKFNTTLDGNTYVFSTDQAYTITPAGSVYSVSDVIIKEGDVLTHRFIKDVANTGQRFVMPNANVDITSLLIKVQTSVADQTNAIYTLADDILAVDGTSEVYYTYGAEDNKYEVGFGDGVLGKALEDDNVIDVTYRVNSGPKTNGADTFSSVDSIQGFNNITVTTQTKAGGGVFEESVSSIKFNAPLNFETQNRGVTSNDYKRLTENKFPEFSSVRAYGGDEAIPPVFGKVFIAIKPSVGDVLSQTKKDEVETYLKERGTTSIDPVVIDPAIFYLKSTSTVTYDTKKTTKSANQLESDVKTSMVEYGDTTLGSFNGNFKYSNFTTDVDASDVSITSNDTSMQIIKRLIPELNVAQDFVIEYNNELFIFDDSDTPHFDHNPSVFSTRFVYAGNQSFMQDDGGGILFIYHTGTDGSRVITVANAGTVDYTTGKVLINSFTISSFLGDHLDIHAVPKNKNLDSVNNQILQIEELDLAITAVPDQ